MLQAYVNNPTLQKQRAALRAADEQVPIAKSAARPNLDADAEVGYARNDISGRQINTQPRGVGLTLTQPLYKGGRIQSGITSAETTVLAQRAQLQGGEQTLFLNVVQAYLDVARDQAVLRLSRENEKVLLKEKQAATDRFQIGNATRTDVTQAESRYAGARRSH